MSRRKHEPRRGYPHVTQLAVQDTKARPHQVWRGEAAPEPGTWAEPRKELPDGVLKEMNCEDCGSVIWLGRLTGRDALRRCRFYQSGELFRLILLEPEYQPGCGTLSWEPDGITLLGRGLGSLLEHRCAAITRACRNCEAPVRVVRQAGRDYLLYLDDDPTEGGTVYINDQGRGRHDPRHLEDGLHYRLHCCNAVPAPPQTPRQRRNARRQAAKAAK